ncbi:hypothetical protein SCP_0600070 [Sparassis crispa]|uniref:Uncharacterized protein n=1 Tax=Sparassis crispa TaxID=139825 RepID=A0A401GPD7_9APHY|nr:hypothetical protein SCP_0600070 [Sparassis crispa]GBE84030.1 hypothetical protein SCP_0600070 [Sparassis crispa]
MSRRSAPGKSVTELWKAPQHEGRERGPTARGGAEGGQRWERGIEVRAVV